MKNYLNPGRAIDCDAPANVDAGGVVVIGALVGVATAAADNGDPVTVQTEGVFELAKASAEVIAIGDTCYVAATNGPVHTNADSDSNSGGVTKIGYAVAAAGAGATKVRVRLVPVV
jgi:predicted RecA/RadA family phage recombinase